MMCRAQPEERHVYGDEAEDEHFERLHQARHKREMALEYHAQAVRRQRESQAAHLAA